MDKSDGQKAKKKLVKKCPYCQSYVKIDVSQCTECGKKIGAAGRDGIALKPIDWKAYTACILSWGALFAYFWLLGWSEPMVAFFKQLYASMKIWSMKVLMAIWSLIVGTWDTIVEILSKLTG